MLSSIPGTHGDSLSGGTVASADEALATRQGLDDCRHLLVDARELGISGRIESAARDADVHGNLLHSMRSACRPYSGTAVIRSCWRIAGREEASGNGSQ